MLKDNEIRRLLKHLRTQIEDENLLAAIEDDLRDDGRRRDYPRTGIFAVFSAKRRRNRNRRHDLESEKYSIHGVTDDTARYQTGKSNRIITRFIEFCAASGEIISVGAYTIFSKSLTLRIDVDKVSDNVGEAHTVTVFFGKGNTEQTIVIDFEQ